MTREEAKEKLELIKAYAEGKTIQIMSYSGDWKDLENPDFNHALQDYRIKPEEEYRPYKDCDEMIAGFKEISSTSALPLIWLKNKNTENVLLITEFDYDNRPNIKLGIYAGGSWYSFEELFDEFTFLDGTPCGVKE